MFPLFFRMCSPESFVDLNDNGVAESPLGGMWGRCRMCGGGKGVGVRCGGGMAEEEEEFIRIQ